MDPMFQLNQSTQTMVMAAGVANLNAQRADAQAARKVAEEKERLEKEAAAKADRESRIHFTINIVASIALLVTFGFASLIVGGAYAGALDDIKKEKIRFTKTLKMNCPR